MQRGDAVPYPSDIASTFPQEIGAFQSRDNQEDGQGDSKACDCEVCRVSKAKRNHVPTEREQPRDEDLDPFSRVWTDVKGKVRPKDHWGNQYIVTFTCEKTRWVYVDFARKKSDIKEAYKTFLEWVKLRGYAVRLLQSDNGGEYTSNEISKVTVRPISTGTTPADRA